MSRLRFFNNQSATHQKICEHRRCARRHARLLEVSQTPTTTANSQNPWKQFSLSGRTRTRESNITNVLWKSTRDFYSIGYITVKGVMAGLKLHVSTKHEHSHQNRRTIQRYRSTHTYKTVLFGSPSLIYTLVREVLEHCPTLRGQGGGGPASKNEISLFGHIVAQAVVKIWRDEVDRSTHFFANGKNGQNGPRF